MAECFALTASEPQQCVQCDKGIDWNKSHWQLPTLGPGTVPWKNIVRHCWIKTGFYLMRTSIRGKWSVKAVGKIREDEAWRGPNTMRAEKRAGEGYILLILRHVPTLLSHTVQGLSVSMLNVKLSQQRGKVTPPATSFSALFSDSGSLRNRGN